jgi:hypothetical protein
MPYIDADYYNNVFKGTPVQDVRELDILIERSSDVKYQNTGYKISEVLSEHGAFVEKQVKKATAVQVLYFVTNGNYENLFTGTSDNKSEKIGAFSYDKEGSNKANLVSNMTIEYLVPTGLLYSGLEVNLS